jgi:hypothetical protein
MLNMHTDPEIRIVSPGANIMIRHSLLAGIVLAIVAAAGTARVSAGDLSNSTSINVSVLPGSAPAAGEASTGSVIAAAAVMPSAGFPAGEALADDGVSPATTRYSDDVAGSQAATPAGTMSPGTASMSGFAVAQDECFNRLCCCACPCVYGDVEALFLQEHPRFLNQPLLVDDITGTVLQTTSDLGSVNDPAVTATFGLRLCGGRAVEFTYFGLFRNGTSTAFANPDPANIVMTFPTGPQGNVFLNMDGVQTSYSSYLNSFEVNFPCCCGCCSQDSCGCDDCGCDKSACGQAACGTAGDRCGQGKLCCRSIEWFAGFRYMELGNDLDLAAQSFSPNTETGDYSVHTVNRLFGGQIGGRIRGTVNRFGLELTGKAGIYDNDATESQTVIDFPNFPLRPTTTAQSNYAAFEGELNLSGIYRLSNAWSVKAGYSVIWIEGLALAPDQLDFNFSTSPSGNQLSAAGGLFLHGANVGLEARW